MAFNLLSEMSDGLWSAYVQSATSPALDKSGVSIAIADMLKADTTTLYGTGNLLQIIEPNPVKYSKAKIDNTNAYGLYLWAEGDDNLSRSQNKDQQFIINMRFEGKNLDPNNAVQQIDDAYQQVLSLVDTQMWNGQMMTDYYTDTNAQIFNLEPIASSLPAPEPGDGQTVIIEIEGAILVEVNRWR
jgi:hypothetical protein